MILVDTSAWIEFQRESGSPVERRLSDAIAGDQTLATMGLVVLELLAGARDERQARDLRRLLDRCRYLAIEDPSDFEAAAAIYRACRRSGATVRRLPDCLIAVVAMRSGAQVLHQDSDFDLLARVAPLEVCDVGR